MQRYLGEARFRREFDDVVEGIACEVADASVSTGIVLRTHPDGPWAWPRRSTDLPWAKKFLSPEERLARAVVVVALLAFVAPSAADLDDLLADPGIAPPRLVSATSSSSSGTSPSREKALRRTPSARPVPRGGTGCSSRRTRRPNTASDCPGRRRPLLCTTSCSSSILAGSWCVCRVRLRPMRCIDRGDGCFCTTANCWSTSSSALCAPTISRGDRGTGDRVPRRQPPRAGQGGLPRPDRRSGPVRSCGDRVGERWRQVDVAGLPAACVRPRRHQVPAAPSPAPATQAGRREAPPALHRPRCRRPRRHRGRTARR